MNDASLLPNGRFHEQQHNLQDHFSIDCDHINTDKIGNVKKKCNLRTWYGGQSQHTVKYCMKFYLNLCVHCYKLFHI